MGRVKAWALAARDTHATRLAYGKRMASARNRREWSAIGAAYAAERTQLQFGEQLCLDVVEAHLDGRSVLDAGCGSGFLAREMASRGASVFGIDISHELLRRAQASESGASHPVQYAVHDLTVSLPFPDEAFDVAVSAMTLMDVEDLLLAVRHVARVIRPGGERSSRFFTRASTDRASMPPVMALTWASISTVIARSAGQSRVIQFAFHTGSTTARLATT